MSTSKAVEKDWQWTKLTGSGHRVGHLSNDHALTIWQSGRVLFSPAELFPIRRIGKGLNIALELNWGKRYTNTFFKDFLWVFCFSAFVFMSWALKFALHQCKKIDWYWGSILRESPFDGWWYGKDDIFSENLLALLSSSPNIWLFLRAHFSFICSHIPTNAAVSSLNCQKSFTSSTIISQNSILFETIKIDILILLLIITIIFILIKLAMSALIWLRVSASKTCGASSLPGLRHSVKPWLRWRWGSEEDFEFDNSKSAQKSITQMPGLRHSVKPWLIWRWWSEEGFELPWASFDYLKSAQKIIAQMPGLDGAGSSYCSWRWLWWWWWLRNLRKLCLCIKQRRPHIVHLIKGSKFMLLAFV